VVTVNGGVGAPFVFLPSLPFFSLSASKTFVALSNNLNGFQVNNNPLLIIDSFGVDLTSLDTTPKDVYFAILRPKVPPFSSSTHHVFLLPSSF
jgi:hypothetical protein